MKLSLWKKIGLILASVLVIIVLLLGTISSIFVVTVFNESYMLQHFTSAFPDIVKDKRQEIVSQGESYVSDYTVLGDMAVIIYKEYGDKTLKERLEIIRDQLGLTSVSVVDNNGNFLGTMDNELKNALTKEETQFFLDNKGEQILLSDSLIEKLPDRENSVIECRSVGAEDAENLLLEYDFTPLVEIGNQYGTWQSILERMLSGLDGYAFVLGKEDFTTFAAYPTDDLSDEELSAIKEYLVQSVSEGYKDYVKLNIEGDRPSYYAPMTINGEMSLLEMNYYEEEDVYVFIAAPLSKFVHSALITAVVLVVFLIFSLILFAIYASKKTADLYTDGDPKAMRKMAKLRTFPGLLTIIIMIACFYTMLMLLLSMGNTAYTSETQKNAINYEVNYHNDIARRYKTEFPQKYLLRTNAIAALLSHNESLRTEEELKKLSDICNAEYVMLFDKDGKEIISSNEYTDFEVTNNKDNELSAFYPMVKGYKNIVADPYKETGTGKTLLTIGARVKNAQGKPDGFILLSADASAGEELASKESLVHIINAFATQENQMVALVDDSTGLFSAHTDKGMIGADPRSVLDESVLNRSFQGFTSYDHKEAYLLGTMVEGDNLLVISYYLVGSVFTLLIVVMIIMAALIIGLFFYPIIATLSCGTYAEGKKKLGEITRMGNSKFVEKSRPMHIFIYGYVIFFTILYLYSLFVAKRGKWPEMGFVFGETWTNGVHLFSIWMSIFVISYVLTLVFIVRAALAKADSYLSTKTRTVFRLVDSLIMYAAAIGLLCKVFSMFGVDTAALIASAGVVSIAVGMGAKDLVTDVMAGLFMIFEGSIHVGDVVKISSFKGSVTDMGIRTTEVTNDEQEVLILSNSKIKDIINMSRNKNIFKYDLLVSRSISADNLQTEIDRFTELANGSIPETHNTIQMEGITDVNEAGYNVRLTYTCDETVSDNVKNRLEELVKKQVFVILKE